MDATKTKFKTVEEYLSIFPKNVRTQLQELRETIKKAAPEAEEKISYNMPAYKFHGMLVYFAAYQGHIGFYPGASPIKVFEKELASYEGSKGTVRFPIDEQIPLNLVSKIVKFRAKENMEKSAKAVKRK